MGNIVGSNILNVLLILGLSAFIVPLVVSSDLIRRDVPLMILASLLVLAFGLDGKIGRSDGFLFFGGLLAYTYWCVRQSRRESQAVLAEFAQATPQAVQGVQAKLRQIGLVVGGVVLLGLGSAWLVSGAVTVAEALGISQLIIGLTIVAAGTSLPEAVTSIVAACRGERDIAVGNVIGSNLFNILGVLGVTSLIAPRGVTVSPVAMRFDIPVMIAVAIACLPIVFTGNRISRAEGGLFCLYYAAYTLYLVLDATGNDFSRTLADVMIVFVIPLTVITLAIAVLRSLPRGQPLGDLTRPCDHRSKGDEALQRSVRAAAHNLEKQPGARHHKCPAQRKRQSNRNLRANPVKGPAMNRRKMLLTLGLGATGGALPAWGQEPSTGEATDRATRGLPTLTITDIRCMRVKNLCVVKVMTSEPGLIGLGCATYQQRPMTVETAVQEYLRPFAVGRCADNIEDLWQTAYTSSYWRNGPVLNNALSGLDQALWDIKGKRAGMPVYQLLGGKCRFAVDTYKHCSGRDFQELEDRVKQAIDEGFRHVRIQLGDYGSPHLAGDADFKAAGFGAPADRLLDVKPYLRAVPRMFEHIRTTCGEEIELAHDIHERVQPLDAIQLVKQLEQYHPFFVEDPFPTEVNEQYLPLLRQQTATPIAVGELFNNPDEWIDLITNRWIDFIRVHISQTGGLSVARKIAALAEWFGVRSAWHGPGDVSPIGHAANAHLDLAIHNFGIQEFVTFPDELREIFPGCPTMKDGYMYVREAPGLGVDINESLAAKAGAWGTGRGSWLPLRKQDGTSVRP